MSVPTLGAFYGHADLHQQAVTLLDNLPDRRFLKKVWRARVARHDTLSLLRLRSPVIENCGCLFYHLTGLADDTKVFHEARRRYNFPLEFSGVLMGLYDNHPGKPAPLAREMLRAVKPGSNLYQVAYRYYAADRSDRTWPTLKRLLEAHAPNWQLAA
jgi:hypothetical protein